MHERSSSQHSAKGNYYPFYMDPFDRHRYPLGFFDDRHQGQLSIAVQIMLTTEKYFYGNSYDGGNFSLPRISIKILARYDFERFGSLFTRDAVN